MMAWLEAIDHALFTAVFAPGDGLWSGLMRLGSELAYYRNFPFYLCLLAWPLLARFPRLTIAARQRWQHCLGSLLLAYGASFLWVVQLKDLFHRPRPFVALPGIVPMMPESAYSSFPSGHAAFAMLMVAGLWPVAGWRGRAGLLACLLWAGWSRLALGVHFPSDVLGGMGISLAILLLIRWLLGIIKSRGTGSRGFSNSSEEN